MLTPPDLSVKKLKVSSHAVQRAIERLGCKDRVDATNYIKSRMGFAKYCGIVTRQYKTRSHRVKEECEQMIIKLHNQLRQKEVEIEVAQMTKRQLVRAMAEVL